MLDERTILTKYGELCMEFKNKQIDDYDTFIKSRLIEYVYNTVNEELDIVVSSIKKAMGDCNDMR